MKKLIYLVLFIVIGNTVFGQSWNIITGKNEYTDSARYRKLKNNVAGDSILSTDITGKLKQILKPSGGIIAPGVDSITLYGDTLRVWSFGTAAIYPLGKYVRYLSLNYDSTRIIYLDINGNPLDSVYLRHTIVRAGPGIQIDKTGPPGADTATISATGTGGNSDSTLQQAFNKSVLAGDNPIIDADHNSLVIDNTSSFEIISLNTINNIRTSVFGNSNGSGSTAQSDSTEVQIQTVALYDIGDGSPNTSSGQIGAAKDNLVDPATRHDLFVFPEFVKIGSGSGTQPTRLIIARPDTILTTPAYTWGQRETANGQEFVLYPTPSGGGSGGISQLGTPDSTLVLVNDSTYRGNVTVLKTVWQARQDSLALVAAINALDTSKWVITGSAIYPKSLRNVLIGTTTDAGYMFREVGNARFDLGSDATGDMFYRDALGGFTRLGIGTNGQALRVVSGLPAWRDTTVGGGGGITTLNTLTASTQTFTTGTSGSDFGISSATSTHTFNLPTASATNRGALSTTDWSAFTNKWNVSGGNAGVAYPDTTSKWIGTSNNTPFWWKTNGLWRGGIDSMGSIVMAQANRAINIRNSASTGVAAIYTVDRSITIGGNVIATPGIASVTIGNQSSATSTGSVSIGYTATGQGISISNGGQSATSAGTGIAFGASVSAITASMAMGTSTSTSSGGLLAIGNNAKASGTNAIAIGNVAVASGTNSIVLGNTDSATHNYSFAMGTGAKTTANNQWVAGGYITPGSVGYTNVFFGSGPQGDAKTTNPGVSYTINGSGGFGTDQAGGNLGVAGGLGTSAGVPGYIFFSTGTATATGSTLQSLTERVRILANGNVGIGNTTANSNLTVTGSVAMTYRAITGARTLDGTDYTIECTANTFTVTLPTAVGITGRIYNIANSGAGTITIGTTSSQTFVNVALTPTVLTLAAVGNITVQSNGANWLQLQ